MSESLIVAELCFNSVVSLCVALCGQSCRQCRETRLHLAGRPGLVKLDMLLERISFDANMTREKGWVYFCGA